MRKLHYLILLMVAMVTLGSCLKKTDILLTSHPYVSGKEDSVQYFSSIAAATFEVEGRCGEEMRRLQVKTFPPCSWKDTTIVYDHFIHQAKHIFDFQMSTGHKIASRDSLYEIFFSLQTDFDTVDVRRWIRFKYIYPAVDSFDVCVGGAPADTCLIDVKNKTAYPYTMYRNRQYDLVFVNELRNSYDLGASLTSPDAPINVIYFQKQVPEYPYEETVNHSHRQTLCGFVDDGKGDISWLNFNGEMLGRTDNWQYPELLKNKTEWGYGVYNLQFSRLYKFQLQDNSLIMVRVLEMQNVGKPSCKVKLRVYSQKK